MPSSKKSKDAKSNSTRQTTELRAGLVLPVCRINKIARRHLKKNMRMSTGCSIALTGILEYLMRESMEGMANLKSKTNIYTNHKLEASLQQDDDLRALYAPVVLTKPKFKGKPKGIAPNPIGNSIVPIKK